MTTPTTPAIVDEYDEYPVHEEDNVPESWIHERIVRYLRDVLDILFPDWFIAGNLCIYWQKGNKRRYAAPDVFVVREAVPRARRKNYLLWRDPPVSFVAEIGSDSTRRIDLERKPEIYSQHIKANEYFFADPPDEERPHREMRLWRLTPDGYVPVEPGANGRLFSEVLGIEFGWDDEGMLRAYVDGIPQRTHEESEAALSEEARRRQEAEANAGESLLRREEAETRRQEAEVRAAELERQLAELRARLGE